MRWLLFLSRLAFISGICILVWLILAMVETDHWLCPRCSHPSGNKYLLPGGCVEGKEIATHRTLVVNYCKHLFLTIVDILYILSE